MDFRNKIDMKKIVIYLIGIMIIAYGICGAMVLSGGGKLLKGNKMNMTANTTKTANITGIKEIKVQAESEDINVIPEGTNVVKAHLSGSIASSSKYIMPELQLDKSGDTLFVKVVHKTHMTFGFFSSNLKLDVYIPNSYNQSEKISLTSGNININNSKLNKLICSLSSGDLYLKNVTAGDFSYNCSSGNLDGEGLTTLSTTLNSTSGSSNITNFRGDLKATSTSGDIDVEYGSFNNNADVHVTSGDVSLKLPKNSKFHLNSTTISGDITCDFPIILTQSKKQNHLEGDIGTSKNTVRLDVISGNIRCLSR